MTVRLPRKADWAIPAALAPSGVLLAPGAPGASDSVFAGLSPCQLLKIGSIFHLFYIGADGLRASDNEPAYRALHLATGPSPSSLTKHGSNPVLTHVAFAAGQDTGESGIFSACAWVDSAGAFGPAGRMYLWAGAMREFSAGQVNNDVKVWHADPSAGVYASFTLITTGDPDGIVLEHDDPTVTNSADEISPLGVFRRAADGKIVLVYQAEGTGAPAWSPNVAILSNPWTKESTTNVKVNGVAAGAQVASNGGTPILFGDGTGAIAVGPAHHGASADWYTFTEAAPDQWQFHHTDNWSAEAPEDSLGSFTAWYDAAAGKWHLPHHTRDWFTVTAAAPEMKLWEASPVAPTGPNGTPLLDEFIRNDSAALGANWTEGVWLGSNLSIVSNAIQHAGANNDFSDALWNLDTYGPRCEVWIKIARLSANNNDELVLGLRIVQPGPATMDGYLLVARRKTAGTNELELRRLTNNAQTTIAGPVAVAGLTDGSSVCLAADEDVLSVYHRPDGGAWAAVAGAGTADATHGGAGQFYLFAENDGVGVRVSEFGGGTWAPGPTLVARGLDTRWNVRALAARSLAARWSTLALAGRGADLRWGLRALAGRGLDTRWSIRALAGRALDLRWGLRALAGRGLDTRWSIRALAGRALDLRWTVASVLALVGRGLGLKWGVRALAARALDIRWGVASFLAQVGRGLELRWAARANVGAGLDLRWSLRALAARALSLPWSTLALAARGLDARWSTLALAGRALSARWSVRALAGRGAEFRWARQAFVARALTLAWNLGIVAVPGQAAILYRAPAEDWMFKVPAEDWMFMA